MLGFAVGVILGSAVGVLRMCILMLMRWEGWRTGKFKKNRNKFIPKGE